MVHPQTRRLQRKVHGRVIRIGRKALRCLLARRGITFQRTKTWKESPDRDAKLDCIIAALDDPTLAERAADVRQVGRSLRRAVPGMGQCVSLALVSRSVGRNLAIVARAVARCWISVAATRREVRPQLC